jgi:hypothetical protein
VKLSTSPAYFEAIANHPRVFKRVSRKGIDRIDLAPVWSHCVGLEFDGGGWLCQRIHAGLWEVHTLFLPGNHHVRDCAVEALRFMFTVTDCNELCTKVPCDVSRAKELALDMGFSESYHRDDGWQRESGPVAVDYLHYRIESWALGLAATPDQAYANFLALCEAGGQQDKGNYFYSRWAVLAQPEEQFTCQ